MEAIILAGGHGSRLKSVVNNVPKPMADIHGKPFLEILLNSLDNAGFTRVILALHYMPEKIIEYFGSKFKNITLEYVIEDRKLGTGGAIKNSLEYCNNKYVYVFNGDSFIDLDFINLSKFCDDKKIPIIVGQVVKDISRYGEIKHKNNIVTGFLEKGSQNSGIINAGCYILPRNIFENFQLKSNFSFEVDFLSRYINKLKFHLYVNEGLFIDIGIPEDYFKALEIFSNSEQGPLN